MAAEYDHTCECGLKWRVRKIKTIMRDSDYENCTCGREIIRWNGAHMFTVKSLPETEKSGPK